MANKKEVAKVAETELVVPDTAMSFNPEVLIAKAIENNAPLEVMEKILSLAERVNAIKAKQEFVKAKAKFQAECPIIEKTKDGAVTGGKAAYQYAPIDAIVSQVRAIISAHGFSYAFDQQEEADGKMKVCCKVTHLSGHEETTCIKVSLGQKTGIMNESQREMAGLTYAKRYAFCNAFGITTGDDDTDNNDPSNEKDPLNSSVPPTNQKLKNEICHLLEKLEVNYKDKIIATEFVKQKTRLDLMSEENYVEIKNLLSILVDEKNGIIR